MSQEHSLDQAPHSRHPTDWLADDLEWAKPGRAPIPPRYIGAGAGPVPKFVKIALLVAVFFCGWSLLRAGPINLTLSDILLSLVMAVLLYRGDVETRPFGELTVFWFLGLGLMISGLLFGSMINNSVDRWLVVSAQYLFAFLLIPMILMGQQTSLTRILPALFVLGISVSQLIGVSASLLFDHSDTVGLFGDGFLSGNGRVGAMTGEPNPNGAMIAFALPMLFYSVRRHTMPMGIGVLCGIMLCWGLLATGSFTGFVAATIATCVYFTISGVWVLVRVALLGAIGVGLFVASGLPLPESFEERVVGALTTGDLDQAGTFTDRSQLIAEAWEMADDNMFVGLGVDRFRIVSSHGAPVHELHLLIWNEGGIIAVIGLLMVILTAIAAAVRAVSRSRAEGAMILAVVVVFNVYTFSIPHMYSRAWILPVLLALSTYFARQSGANSARHTGANR